MLCHNEYVIVKSVRQQTQWLCALSLFNDLNCKICRCQAIKLNDEDDDSSPAYPCYHFLNDGTMFAIIICRYRQGHPSYNIYGT